MLKSKFSILQPNELLRMLQSSFSMMPLVTRDCVKSLTLFYFNLQQKIYTPDFYREAIILILKGLPSSDQYLKSLIHVVLEELSTRSDDGILGINTIVKNLEDKKTADSLRNTSLKGLFSNLPSNMKYDFQKYISSSLMNDKFRNTAICISSEYFKDQKVPVNIYGTVEDYHSAYFNRLPINKYSCMIELRRIGEENKEISKITEFLNLDVEKIIFFEAAKSLCKFKPEMAAGYVDKTVSILRHYLTGDEEDIFLSIKILNTLSVNFPSKVAKANREVEDLVQSTSKSVSMLAIITLLKTGNDETVKQLASKIAPLMNTMSESYKTMAINTMEKLAKESKDDFIVFLKNAMKGKGELHFKRFILKKFEGLVKHDQYRPGIIKFLCSYVEDPDYYQLNMDILGILGGYLCNKKDIIHVYNRLILDNPHVRCSAIQSLFDLNDTFNCFDGYELSSDLETQRFASFLKSNIHLKKGIFDVNELGDLKDEVLKYIDLPSDESKIEAESEFIKECRSINLTPDDSDVAISVIKKVFINKIILEFTATNKMEKVSITNSNLMLSPSNGERLEIEFKAKDFDNKKAVKEIEIPNQICTFDAIFDYELCYSEDFDDAENDSVILAPFDITVLDLTRPVSLNTVPKNSENINLKFKLQISEAISKIVEVCNMFIIADSNHFTLTGVYNKIPLVIKGECKHTKHTSVSLSIHCEDENVLNSVKSVFY